MSYWKDMGLGKLRALQINGHKASDCSMRKNRAQEGGAPNHVDTYDFAHQIGNIINCPRTDTLAIPSNGENLTFMP
eukprot:1236709-Ditylum_brightwellii.AAC.1